MVMSENRLGRDMFWKV